MNGTKSLKVTTHQITEFVWPDSVSGQVGLWVPGLLTVCMGVMVFSSDIVNAIGLDKYQAHLGAFWLGLLVVHVFEYFHHALPVLREFSAPTSVYVTYFAVTFVSGFGAWIPLKAKAAQLRTSSGRTHTTDTLH